MFFATTEETATWILNRPGVIASLADVLQAESMRAGLRETDIADGPLRLSGTPDGQLLLMWNVDYLGGTGEERWGLVKLDPPLGLLAQPDVIRRVLQTFFEVTSLRLRNLIPTDGKLIHRSYDDGTNTIRADRGGAGSALNLAYTEDSAGRAGSQRRYILFVGPAYDLGALRSRARAEAEHILPLTDAAQRVLNRKERRPLMDAVLSVQAPLTGPQGPAFARATVATHAAPTVQDRYSTASWTFDDWMRAPDMLSAQQRAILNSNVPMEHPVRIVGPAGSGKTLTMQLMALKHLRAAAESGEQLRVLYVVHNAALAESLHARFAVLGGERFTQKGAPQELAIKTLSEYAQEELKLEDTIIIDKDAYETKLFQIEQVADAIDDELAARPSPESELGSAYITALLYSQPSLKPIFCQLISAEISTAIKGHGLTGDRQRYIYADRALSRLHRVMNTFDRDFVFSVFRRYHREVFEINGYLDTDDIALTLFGNLNTPLWRLKRQSNGYDAVLVDETQLFNENERRIFHLLTRRQTAPQSIALAIDEGQEFFGQSTAGLSALGIADIEEERLPANHRSTKEIVDLAFFVISKSTDLFGPGFPVYSTDAATVSSSDSRVSPPRLDTASGSAKSIGSYVANRIEELRRSNIVSICVVVHAEVYWQTVLEEVRAKVGRTKDHFEELTRRGQAVPDNAPTIAVARPAHVGGQEFEAVIAVGLEYGVTPPRVVGNDALEAALFQQTVREMYLSLSRARYRVMIVNAAGSAPNEILKEALARGLVAEGNRHAARSEGRR